MHAQGQKVPVQELAVRFNCAMQDLQLLGLIKEAAGGAGRAACSALCFPCGAEVPGHVPS